MSFCVNEFEVDVNDCVFPGNKHQKVYIDLIVFKNMRQILRY